MTAEHTPTPTPWRLDSDDTSIVVTTEGRTIFGVSGTFASEDEDYANAEYIVRCVNAHDELVAALSAITDRYAAEVLRTDGQMPSENEYVKAALAALKKAHGGTS